MNEYLIDQTVYEFLSTIMTVNKVLKTIKKMFTITSFTAGSSGT